MLHQTTGYLLIRECWICHTAGARAISFEGDAMKLADTHFCYGQGGMLSIEDAASAEIVDCTFKHAQAEYGGAVYADTIHDVLLRRCSFESWRRLCTLSIRSWGSALRNAAAEIARRRSIRFLTHFESGDFTGKDQEASVCSLADKSPYKHFGKGW